MNEWMKAAAAAGQGTGVLEYVLSVRYVLLRGGLDPIIPYLTFSTAAKQWEARSLSKDI